MPVRPAKALFFGEVAVAAVVTFLTYKADDKLLLPAIAGSLMYLFLSAKVALHHMAEEDLFRKYPALQQLSELRLDDPTVTTMELRGRISNAKLAKVHSRLWGAYCRHVDLLATERRTDNLYYSEYIQMITERLELAQPGEKVFAVSGLTHGEFADHPAERSFHDAQLAALARNVDLRRLFIGDLEKLEALKISSSFADHATGKIPCRHLTHNQYLGMLQGSSLEMGICFADEFYVDIESTAKYLSGYLSVKPERIEPQMRLFEGVYRQAGKLPT